MKTETNSHYETLPAFFLEAIYHWLESENLRSMIHCRITDECKIPPQFRAEKVINFNITSEAVNKLFIDSNGVSFQARFSGKEETVYIPFKNVVAISCSDIQFVCQHPYMPTVPVKMNFTEQQQELGPVPTPYIPVEPVAEPVKKKNPFTLIQGGKVD